MSTPRTATVTFDQIDHPTSPFIRLRLTYEPADRPNISHVMTLACAEKTLADLTKAIADAKAAAKRKEQRTGQA